MGRPVRAVAALATAVLLWASFALTIRGIGGSGLMPVDAAILRFVTPVILLAPWLPRAIRAARRERAGLVAALCLAGLPHFLLSALGGSLTSAALVGLLLPGSVPLFVALILAGWRHERVGRQRAVALAAIVSGVVAAAVLTTSAATLAGIGVLLAAGCAWAIYTIALRSTALDLVSLVLVVCVPSALAAVVLAATGVLPSSLGRRAGVEHRAVRGPAGRRNRHPVDVELRVRGPPARQQHSGGDRRDQPGAHHTAGRPTVRRADHGRDQHRAGAHRRWGDHVQSRCVARTKCGCSMNVPRATMLG
ncbi:DMT family transporter [Actinoplanes sp. NBC_00393]